jgi:CheY-like chemotaxis protein
VLIVEDAEEVLELATKLLRRQGHTVLAARNGDDALELFDRTPGIDVILTDVVMPGWSGPELIKHLQARRPGVRAVYMSGYTEDAVVNRGELEPGVVFLHKPFTSESLQAKLREALDRAAAS